MNALIAATVLGEKTAVLNFHDDDSIVAAMMEPGATRMREWSVLTVKKQEG